MNKLTGLQREICVWLIVCLVIGVIGGCYIENTPNQYPGMIRLHIIANSDSEEDQSLKLKVRDAILSHMEGQETLADTRSYLEENMETIESVSEEVITENGYDYSAKGKLAVTFIPVKSYDGLTLPAGNYEALNVTLGAGKGQNWWCVIFPQLCIPGKKKSEKIVLKSKIKELMQKSAKKKGNRRH